METYSTPVPASYTYRTRNFDGTFNLFHVKVNIVGESPKSYLVETLTPLAGIKRLSRMTVRKHNVHATHTDSGKTRPDCTGQWWHN